MLRNVCVFGTFDSKRDAFELLIHELQRNKNCTVTAVNVGTRPATLLNGLDEDHYHSICEVVVEEETGSASDQKTNYMQRAVELAKRDGKKLLAKVLTSSNKGFTHAVSMGGSNGTGIALELMSVLPESCSKHCLSTLAPQLDGQGVDMIPSIVDIVAMNPVLKSVIQYVAKLINGTVPMPLHKLDAANLPPPANDDPVGKTADELMWYFSKITDFEQLTAAANRTVGCTMFGNTTPCVERCLKILNDRGYSLVVFHAVGTGGEMMGRLIDMGVIRACLDITTTEVTDLICGGDMYANRRRFYAPGRNKVPHLIVPGCVDMINFFNDSYTKWLSTPSSVSADGERRTLLWGGVLTIVRSDVEENRKIGRFLANVANEAEGPVAVAVPGTFSKVGAPKGVFHWPQADASFRGGLKARLKSHVELIECPDVNINDDEFVDIIAEKMIGLIENNPTC